MFSLGVSQEKTISQFSDFINTTGIIPKHNIDIIPDGDIHRFSLDTDKGGAKSGAYCLHMDSCPAGWVQDWHRGGEKLLWKFDYSDEERREYGQLMHTPEYRAKAEKERKEIERQKAEKLKLQKEEQEKARAMAFAEYKHAYHVDFRGGILAHPYMQNKFAGTGISFIDDEQFEVVRDGRSVLFPPKWCRDTIKNGICKKDELLVPMRNIATGEFQTLIRIPSKPDTTGHWPKLYYTDAPSKGAGHIIEPRHAKEEVIYICEGFATAFAVMVAIESQYKIIAAGGCNNFVPVCKALRKSYTGKIIIAADNDEAGLKAANDCVNQGIANAIIKPQTAGFDWCDELIKILKKGANVKCR